MLFGNEPVFVKYQPFWIIFNKIVSFSKYLSNLFEMSKLQLGFLFINAIHCSFACVNNFINRFLCLNSNRISFQLEWIFNKHCEHKQLQSRSNREICEHFYWFEQCLWDDCQWLQFCFSFRCGYGKNMLRHCLIVHKWCHRSWVSISMWHLFWTAPMFLLVEKFVFSAKWKSLKVQWQFMSLKKIFVTETAKAKWQNS